MQALIVDGDAAKEALPGSLLAGSKPRQIRSGLDRVLAGPRGALVGAWLHRFEVELAHQVIA